MKKLDRKHGWLAFFSAIPIGVLGGLIGLGGAEFRLPVLVQWLGYSIRQAVPLNLATSLVTLSFGLLSRSRVLDPASLLPLLPLMLAITLGAMSAAYFGSSLLHRVKSHQIERLILVILTGIGILLIVEGFARSPQQGWIPPVFFWQALVALAAGLAIGFVSSVLGVAGGELIIPSLIFLFGVDVKLAGSASIFISLPTVIVGLVGYIRRGVFRENPRLTITMIPLSAGSILGALLGGIMVQWFVSSVLKVLLGIILIISAYRMIAHARRRQPEQPN